MSVLAQLRKERTKALTTLSGDESAESSAWDSPPDSPEWQRPLPPRRRDVSTLVPSTVGQSAMSIKEVRATQTNQVRKQAFVPVQIKRSSSPPPHTPGGLTSPVIHYMDGVIRDVLRYHGISLGTKLSEAVTTEVRTFVANDASLLALAEAEHKRNEMVLQIHLTQRKQGSRCPTPTPTPSALLWHINTIAQTFVRGTRSPAGSEPPSPSRSQASLKEFMDHEARVSRFTESMETHDLCGRSEAQTQTSVSQGTQTDVIAITGTTVETQTSSSHATQITQTDFSEYLQESHAQASVATVNITTQTGNASRGNSSSQTPSKKSVRKRCQTKGIRSQDSNCQTQAVSYISKATSTDSSIVLLSVDSQTETENQELLRSRTFASYNLPSHISCLFDELA